MIRKIIKINEEKCDGCGQCCEACHEGAIGIIDGKAKLLRDDYCDGLGDCLQACPKEAITFEEREAVAYDKTASLAHVQKKDNSPPSCGCLGASAYTFQRNVVSPAAVSLAEEQSALMQWPVQIKLIPIDAHYFEGASLLVSADCAAYAYANFHSKFMTNKVTIIGCPKLDEEDYSEKLTAIIQQNDIKSITVVRMEVPCCGGISNAVLTAIRNSGKAIPLQAVTISTYGKILYE